MRFSFRFCSRRLVAFVPLLLLTVQPLQCYSVLSHEAMIDAMWDPMLKPIILARFPGTPPEQLKEAHSYAYGGSIIQDMGFYPHGNGYFSDLTHYVRSADFIRALLADSRTPNDLAFALGALSHFGGDCEGHSLGTNVSEAVLYPKLARKHGTPLTYEMDPSKHLKTEFGLDVLQVAEGHYASQSYHDFIGFNVAAALLERAFRETYGFQMSSMFDDLPTAIGSYRRTVSKLIPLATRVAWAEHEDEIQKSRHGVRRGQFIYKLKRSQYEQEWGTQYQRPSVWDRILAFLVKILPPIGPLQALHYKTLTPPAQHHFQKSLEAALNQYRDQLAGLQAKKLDLPNLNFDTGAFAPPTNYKLQDDSYAYWLDQLAKDHFSSLTPAVRGTILSYYADLTLPFSTKKNDKQWEQVLLELSELRSASIAQQKLD